MDAVMYDANELVRSLNIYIYAICGFANRRGAAGFRGDICGLTAIVDEVFGSHTFVLAKWVLGRLSTPHRRRLGSAEILSMER